MLRAFAAALHPRNVCCILVKGSFTHITLCNRHTSVVQTSVSKVCSSSLGALGPSWRLELLYALVGVGVRLLADTDVALHTALDVVIRDGVVILGFGCAVGELPTAFSLSGARVDWDPPV